MITGRTHVMGIVGDPITQARTPALVNELVGRRGLDAVLVPLQVRADALPMAFEGLRAMESVRGVVVTMPHKQAVVPLLDVPSERVRQIGACNIVRFDHSRRATGEIMDGLALVRALGAAGVRLAGERVYLSGAGGAGSAIAHALVASGVAALTVHNRTHARAEALVQQLKAQAGDVHVQTGDVDARGHALVIDATSTGIDDAADPFSFDPATIEAGAAIADITIGARPTPLMTHAGARGHRFIGGEQMLRAQIEAFVDFMLGQDRTV